MSPMLPKFLPSAKSDEELEKTMKSYGLGVSQADDIARTIVWLLSEDSAPVFGANINVGSGIP